MSYQQWRILNEKELHSMEPNLLKDINELIKKYPKYDLDIVIYGHPPKLSKEKIEEVIKEDNLIIESNITNEVFPLDLAKLNIATAKEHTSKHHNSFSDSNALKS